MASDLNNSCRLCLTANTRELLNLFEVRSGDTTIAAVVTKHFWFEVKEEDGYKHICKECWRKLDDFHSFHTQVYNIHNELSATLHSMVKVEIDDGNEALDSIQAIDLQMPNLKDECDMINNVESEETKADCSDNDVYDADITHDDNTSSEEVPKPGAIRRKIRKLTNKRKESVICGSPKMNEENLSHDPSDNSDSDYMEKPPQPPKSKLTNHKKCKKTVKTEDLEDAETDEANTQIQEYLAIDCELCTTHCDTFTNLKLHYRKIHKMEGYLRCCNRKYSKRSLLIGHIQWHLNPEIFKCNICNKTFTRKSSLQEHSKLHSMDDNNLFKCNKCSRSFTKKRILENHLTTHSEERNFICNDCGKSFRTKFLLLSHSKNIHSEVDTHICDVCAKEFRNKAAFEQHKKTVHQNIVLPKVNCHVCGIWLKPVSFKKHMVLHEDSKVDHFCSICGKRSLNRKALHKHMKTVHSDKVYKCFICEKIFKQEISLKEHMPTHTGGTLYLCPHCPKTFNSSSNMYSHKKKMHVKEREEQERLKATGAL